VRTALRELNLSLGDVAQWIDAADYHLKLPGGYSPEQFCDPPLQEIAALQQMDDPKADDGAAGAHQSLAADYVWLARGDPERDHPPKRSQRLHLLLERRSARDLQDHIHGLTVVGLEEGRTGVGGSRVGRRVRPQLRRELTLFGGGGEPDHLRADPLGELHREGPGATRGALDDDGLARLYGRADAQQGPGREPLQQHRRGLLVGDLVRDRDQLGLGDRYPLGVAAARQHGGNPATVEGAAADLGAGNEWELGFGQVMVVALMGVSEVEARPSHLNHDLAAPRHRIGELDELQHLGSTELADLHGPHQMPRLCHDARLVAVTVVGSIAFDAVRTPFGERERMLGGSAVHFALAASFFTEVRVVGPVGEDFGSEDLAVLSDRGIVTADIEQVPGGRTFFWEGHYDHDLGVAHTDDTQLNVFAEFEPKLSTESRASETLFLGNIQPDLQRRVRGDMPGARLVALDSMNLWIETARDSLVAALGQIDCLLLNDAELRQLTGEANLARAARAVRELGPEIVIAKRGEYGAVLFSADDVFAIPGLLLEDVADPTGAGDSFAGGFLGYLDSLGQRPGTEEFRRAMALGSVMASFNVESFGTERVRALNPAEIEGRLSAFKALTHFDERPALVDG